MLESKTYAYYPGCTLHSSAKEYDISARLVCDKLGIKLEELEDWACCGASSAHTTSQLLAITLPARELQSAEKAGLPLTVACAMCFSRLKITAHELADEAKLAQVNEILGGVFHNTTEVVHLLEILFNKIDTDVITKPLTGLKAACYYGCLLVRPKEVMDFDDDENPQIMDNFVEKLGAEAVDWDLKVACCGASLPLTRLDMVYQMSHRILLQAKQQGADCMIAACPMCHSNLDTHQEKMRAKYRDDFELPVIYFTQLLGLALGFSAEQLHLDKHFTNPIPMLKSKGLA
ncbi:CoB--CoM heterodisulfide reductase iron-sulfur subunit B family protein [Chloroflexota bacterium]